MDSVNDVEDHNSWLPIPKMFADELNQPDALMRAYGSAASGQVA
jgi:hypothetical protein